MKTQQNETLRESVQKLITSKSLTVKQLSTILGKSTATASLWLAGIYTGDNASLDIIVADWLERTENELNSNEMESPILETDAFEFISYELKRAHQKGEFRVVYGEAGVGKTEACRFYAKRIPNVIFVEVRTSFTTLFFMQYVHKLVGLSGMGSLPELTFELEQKLKGSQRLLIVDEAEYLPRRALDLLRNLHDHTGIGVVLVGMPALIINLRGKKQDFRQLYSRINSIYNVQACSDADVTKVVQSHFPNSNGLWKGFAKETRNMRSLLKLIQFVKHLMEINKVQVSKELVHEASNHIIL